MKIKGLTIRIVAVPVWYKAEDVAHILSTRDDEMKVWHYPLITVHTDEGVDGYTMGYGAMRDGRAIACLVRDVFWPEIRGEDPLQVERLWQKLRLLNRHLYAVTAAMSGMLDVACWDIAGKVRGVPICDLLGRVRDRVPGYATGWVFHSTPEVAYHEAKRMKADGYRGYKCHFWTDLKRDLPCVRAAREAVGPDFPLMLDLAGTYDLADALLIGRVLDELNFHWFEEPIPDRQFGNLRRLADELKTPILAGETISLEELAEQVRLDCLDVARGDVYLKNGITGLMKAFRLCELHGRRLEVHTVITPLLDVANLHCNCAARNGGFAEVFHPGYRFGLKGKPLDIDADGWLHCPTGPGLGVEIDWDWMDRHTIETIEVN